MSEAANTPAQAHSRRAAAVALLGERRLRRAERQLLAEDRLEELLDRLQRRARWIAWCFGAVALWQGLLAGADFAAAKPVHGFPAWMTGLTGSWHWIVFVLCAALAVRALRNGRDLALLREDVVAGASS